MLLDVVYIFGWLAASPWLIWRRVRHGKNRRGLSQKLLGFVPERGNAAPPAIWLHAVSVGEVNLLEPLTRELGKRFPQHQLLVSTTTETGFDQAVRKFGADNVFFFPFDFSWSVKRAMGRIRPSLVILAELELWPNFLRCCESAGIPVAIANARLSDRSFKSYRRHAWLTGKMFRRLRFVGAQSTEYANRFVSLGVPPKNVAMTGNIKFDGAQTDRRSPAILKLAGELSLPAISNSHVTDNTESSQDPPDSEATRPVLLVAGSTQPEEHEMVLDAWLEAKNNTPNLRLVVVPRHPQSAIPFCQMLKSRSIRYVCRSSGICPSDDPSEVIVVDVIGELPAWWGLASFGYVGGSMGKRGGQSMIEPVALGVPVCFGPDTSNFREIVDRLLAIGACSVVKNSGELAGQISQWTSNGAVAGSPSVEAGRRLVLSGQGACTRFVSCLDFIDSGENQEPEGIAKVA